VHTLKVRARDVGGGGCWGRKFAIWTFLERETRALEKKGNNFGIDIKY
jgi:hypothetical protein